MTDTALISRPKTCDFHPNEDHEAQYDFKTRQGPWGNGCQEAFDLNRAFDTLGTGKGQRLVVITNEAEYRGYKLGIMRTGDVVILHRGDYIDTASSMGGAEFRIDEWMDAE